ncbi:MULTISPECIES: cation:proton antiporter [Mucilaginibacter]|uniref:Sodium:proton antiporter n=1 Tax=Mucilaginibacter rubeus TaxID=2027860 RepID=A0ABX7UFL7_9SPHI|nr:MULTISPECIES: cation:proton antiporter [Mucilaginibacter]QTE44260.1 hypothetical protein J3L19_02445 [Mucilaginibacter rubeus]QTE50860.1 hypothetical protein J3L21_02420 [Mucilaginibacter rubeus]QTE55942.1 hypothetical protein J3L23_27655 [Mucilaginibacter rubeus]QTE64594.1 hypothetical protein J3L22_06170 [Mucilaginibacter rubeus]QTF63355.1 hypothetical protein J3L20_05855 [Mucilaginibacter rubeus]
MELQLNKTKLPLIKKSALVACLPVFIFSFGLALAIYLIEGYSFKSCLANAIPLSIISSSIAIPSVRNYNADDKEFVIYESSISDIIGVIFFNFVLLHTSYGFLAFGSFFLQLIIIIIISFVATAGLSFLLGRIDHHIKFVPIIFLVLLIYETSKVFNLPSLVFILVFGLFLNNLNAIKTTRWIAFLRPKLLRTEVQRFKEITIEGTFLIRSLFFIVFGYSIRTRELADIEPLMWSFGITAGIFVIRALTLRFLGRFRQSLFFIAPRGLITILLFLAIKEPYQIPLISRSMIIQVILMTSIVLMIGSLLNNRPSFLPKKTEEA